MRFELTCKDPASNARAGELGTAHGNIQTPIFMPVGTQGTVKTIRQSDLRDTIEAQIILGNTYHLYLRPGTEILEKAGGLHKFMNWQRPILTDSGGYQVYSLANSRKITEEGVKFQSHIDGSRHFFSPERSMEIQRSIGADIIMAFDECTPYPCEETYAYYSIQRTHRWLDRCIQWLDENPAMYGYDQHLFPIVQGSVYPELRKMSLEKISSVEAVGNAIGGLSVGEPEEDLYAMTDLCCQNLPTDKPRYLMGVGTPWNILECIALGIDMFDCVMPTRNARHGVLYTREGVIQIKNQKWRDDFSAIDADSSSPLSTQHSKAYLRHLMQCKEHLGQQIASLHNLCFYLDLVRDAREHIIAGDFASWKDALVPKLKQKR